MDWSYVAIIIQLIFLEGILSIDNAAVLGAMVSVLPSDQKVPWPKGLQKLGHILTHYFATSASRAAGWLARRLRRARTDAAGSQLHHPESLAEAGGSCLPHPPGLDDLSAAGYQSESGESERRLKTGSFWAVVLNVELMDLAFSLDNVVAAVSFPTTSWW